MASCTGCNGHSERAIDVVRPDGIPGSTGRMQGYSNIGIVLTTETDTGCPGTDGPNRDDCVALLRLQETDFMTNIKPKHGAKALVAMLVCIASSTISGCAALRPIDGMPVDQVPFEWKGQSRDGMQTIDLSLLRRERPPVHVVDGGDVLAIHIGGVFISPEKGDALPPVNFPPNGDPASTGFPVPVRDDGTISIPYLKSILVRGMTVRQVEELLYRKYVDEKKILKEDNAQIVVNLQRARRYRVLVIRQESAQGGGAGGGEAAAAEVRVQLAAAVRHWVARVLEVSASVVPSEEQDALSAFRFTKTMCCMLWRKVQVCQG